MSQISTERELLRNELRDWLHFIRAQGHSLREKAALLFQDAANQPDSTAPARMAQRRVEAALETRPWLRWINKRYHNSACLMTLVGHAGSVKDCAFSPDGSRIVSASGSERRTVGGGPDWIGGELKIWDVQTSSDCTLKVWDSATGECISTLIGHYPDERMMRVDFSPDRSRIISVSYITAPELHLLTLWDAVSESPTQYLAAAAGSGNEPMWKFSPDGKRIATGWSDEPARFDVAYRDESIRIWDAESGTEISTFRGVDRIFDWDFSPDGTMIASGWENGALLLWDATSGAEVTRFRRRPARITRCRFSPNGKLIAASYDDCVLKLWDTFTGEQVCEYFTGSLPWSLEWSLDGRHLVLGCDEDAPQLIRAENIA